MKSGKYAKVGKKKGRPSFRTPSVFKYQKSRKSKVETALRIGYNKKKDLSNKNK